ncbi:MAG: nuclear pore complex subunit [Bacteroidetes bacterium]|nr:MAG: nuclear pore complex subunit [Bacteroidota bacterium]
MKNMQITGTDSTLNIVFSEEDNTLEISGSSLPLDAKEFYQPIIQWINQYAQAYLNNIKVVFQLNYFNTASSRYLLDIMVGVDGFITNGKHAKILWYYEKGDFEMLETGEEFADLVAVPFEFKTY